MKSHNVEDAVLEVIDLLCGDIIGTNANDANQVQYSNLGLELEDEESEGKKKKICESIIDVDRLSDDNLGANGQKSGRNGDPRRMSTASRTRQASAAASSLNRNKSALKLTSTSRRKREQQNENLQIAITELLNHFSHRNLDAIVRVIRMTLEKLRKRITSTLSYSSRLDILIYRFHR